MVVEFTALLEEARVEVYVGLRVDGEVDDMVADVIVVLVD